MITLKEIKPVNPKGNQPWIFTGRTEAEAEAPVLWPPDGKRRLIGRRLWCWERLRAGGEGGSRGWDGWIASLTQWTWVLANSRRWWRTGKPGMLQSTGSQRVRQDLTTEQQYTQCHNKWPRQETNTGVLDPKAHTLLFKFQVHCKH